MSQTDQQATQEWLQLEMLCPPHLTDALSDTLVQEGALGTEERDHSNTQRLLVVYFEDSFSAPQQRALTQALADQGISPESMTWSRLRDDGWSTKWKAFFQPLPIGTQLMLCPTWEEPPQTDRKLLWLDPGMAFGTGHHATTRSCLLLLEELLNTPRPLLDVGCGSGILSMAACLLGATKAYGVDVDAEAVGVANENAALNKLDERCHFDTTPIGQVPGKHPLIVANIQAHILIPMTQQLCSRLAPEGDLVLSGIWHEKESGLLQTFEQNEPHPMSCVRRVEDEGWITLHMRHKTHDAAPELP